MATETAKITWGQWLARRGRFVGYARQEDLAEAIGCSRQHLVRWVRRKAPPKVFRKSLDYALLRVLQTTRETLFESWRTVSPEDSKRVLFHPDQFSLPGDLSNPMHGEMGDLFRRAVEMLYPAELEKTLEYLVAIVITKHDQRYPMFREIADEFARIDSILGGKQRAKP